MAFNKNANQLNALKLFSDRDISFVINIFKTPWNLSVSDLLFKKIVWSTKTEHLIAKKFCNNYAWLAISIVTDDGLAPSGARPSAGAVMIKFGRYMYKDVTLAGLNLSPPPQSSTSSSQTAAVTPDATLITPLTTSNEVNRCGQGNGWKPQTVWCHQRELRAAANVGTRQHPVKLMMY